MLYQKGDYVERPFQKYMKVKDKKNVSNQKIVIPKIEREFMEGQDLLIKQEPLNRLFKLIHLLTINHGATKEQRFLKLFFEKKGIVIEKYFSTNKLVKHHKWLCDQRTKNQLKRNPSFITQAEKSFALLCSKKLKREVMQSFWVGPFQFDFLVFASKRPSYRGIVFEIDGQVHEIESKMKKDSCKDHYISSEFGIIVKHIDNSEVRSPNVEKVLETINLEARLEHKTKLNLLVQISAATMASAYYSKDFGPSYRSHVLTRLGMESSDELDDLLELLADKFPKKDSLSLVNETLRRNTGVLI